MLNAVIIVVALLLAGYLAFSKRLATSSNWKATVTPLASIMGSGFLAWQAKDLPRRPRRLAGFAFLAVMCLLVFALGLPSE